MIANIDSATHSVLPLAMVVVGVEPSSPPARPAPPRPERGVQHGAQHAFAASRERQRPAVSADREESEDRATPRPQQLSRVGAAPFSPFLAQQIAQEVLPEEPRHTAQMLERSHQAYRTSAGDESTLLGPVAPQEMRI